MRFILALKGTQVFSGVLLALNAMVTFYGCALATPPSCARSAPGVGSGGLGYQVLIPLRAPSGASAPPCGCLYPSPRATRRP